MADRRMSMITKTSTAGNATPEVNRTWPLGYLDLLNLDVEIRGLLAALIALCLLAALFAPNFATTGNLLDVLRQVAFTGIIACGMTLVIIAGEIDISVGSAIAFSSALFGTLVVSFHLALWEAALGVVAFGVMVGAGAGAVRAWFNIPSFIVTLAMFSALRGAAMLLTDPDPDPDPRRGVWRMG